MASNYLLKKFYSNFAGIDLRSPDISQNPEAATSMINGKFRNSGSISKREGYQIAGADTVGGFGATTYENVASDGTSAEEYITIDQNLFKLVDDSFTVTYAPGDSSTGRYDLYYDVTDATFYFDLYDGTATRRLHYNIGNGYTGTNRSVADVKTQIDATTNFSATAATATTTYAAFVPTKRNVSLPDGTAVTISFKYFTQIATPSTYSNPFSTFYGQRTSTNFENATFAQLKQILYISTGHDALHKYDGLRVYKAGLPVGTAPTDSVGAGGSLTVGNYLWKYTYVYTDAKGNEIESTPSDTVDFTSAGSDSRVITVTNLQETSGYNVSQAVVNGTQAGVNTITVDAGHGLVVGDYVYVADGVSGTVVNRKVTATASTTITIDGDAVNVNDNEVVSCIKISLYRTQAGGTLFYLSVDMLNDTDNNTQTFDDGIADAAIGAEFVEPIKPHGLPVSGKYIRAWRNQLVISGNTSSTNTVYYSDIESPEYFPPADNSFLVNTTVTGIRELDNLLFVFKDKSIDAVSGDFGTDQFSVDNISNEGTGCKAHATIQEVNKQVWFLSDDGVYSVSAEGLVEQSFPIRPRFLGSTHSFKQAVAYNWVRETKYLVMLPTLDVNPTYANDTTSRIYVYDYFPRHKAWFEWRNFNFLGGISVLDNELFFTRRAMPDATVYEHTFRLKNDGNADDYLDHDAAISFTYKTHWETLGEPAVPKKFLRLKVYALDPTLDDFESSKLSMGVTIYGNFLTNSIGSTTMNFSAAVVGWGAFAWGQPGWGEIILPDIKTKLAGKRLKSQQLEFTNSTAKENVLISGYELEVAAPFKSFLKD